LLFIIIFKYKQDVKTFSDYIEFKQTEAKPLRTIFTTSKQDELEVLERIMQLDPKRRPNASEVKTF
jgi:hypothetical protein